jgi:hypothetical protein
MAHKGGSLSTAELADLLQVVRVRVLGWLCRRGVIEDSSRHRRGLR